MDLEDYQARRLRHCVKCGTPEPVDLEVLDLPTWDGTLPSEGHRAKPGVCPNCGCKVFEEQQEKTEMLLLPAPDGYIPTGGEDVVMESDEMGNPMYYTMQEVPIYKPDVFPLVLQKNVYLGNFWATAMWTR